MQEMSHLNRKHYSLKPDVPSNNSVIFYSLRLSLLLSVMYISSLSDAEWHLKSIFFKWHIWPILSVAGVSNNYKFKIKDQNDYKLHKYNIYIYLFLLLSVSNKQYTVTVDLFNASALSYFAKVFFKSYNTDPLLYQNEDEDVL